MRERSETGRYHITVSNGDWESGRVLLYVPVCYTVIMTSFMGIVLFACSEDSVCHVYI